MCVCVGGGAVRLSRINSPRSMGSQGRDLRLEPGHSTSGCESCLGMMSEDYSFPDHQMTGKERSRSKVKSVMPRFLPLPWIERGSEFIWLPRHLAAAL